MDDLDDDKMVAWRTTQDVRAYVLALPKRYSSTISGTFVDE